MQRAVYLYHRSLGRPVPEDSENANQNTQRTCVYLPCYFLISSGHCPPLPTCPLMIQPLSLALKAVQFKIEHLYPSDKLSINRLVIKMETNLPVEKEAHPRRERERLTTNLVSTFRGELNSKLSACSRSGNSFGRI